MEQIFELGTRVKLLKVVDIIEPSRFEKTWTVNPGSIGKVIDFFVRRYVVNGQLVTKKDFIGLKVNFGEFVVHFANTDSAANSLDDLEVLI